MRPDDHDARYLWDMLTYARTASEIVVGISEEELHNDQRTQLALERAVEIVGEAAGHISTAFRTVHPEVPWRRIVGLRNVIVHTYGQVDHSALWEIATYDIRELITILE